MFANFQCPKYSALLAIVLLLIMRSIVLADEAAETAAAIVRRHYSFDAAVFSYLPDQPLATFEGYGNGSASPNATLGLGNSAHQRNFDVRMEGRLKSQRFLVQVTVTPDKKDTQTKAQEVEYDLSDLTPRTLELARDADGRVYKLNLFPRLHEFPRPEQFQVNKLRLDAWSFHSSAVLVNDHDYIGRLSMSYGNLATCDIAGLAKIEFSLLPLKDARPLGTLLGGVITITHEDGTTITISDVQNGVNPGELRGSPYQVWVRWQPTVTIEEYRESLKEQIAVLRQREKDGDSSLPPGTIERLERMSQADRIALRGSQLRTAKASELADPAK